jgi:DNA-binding response OmpR family regulator
MAAQKHILIVDDDIELGALLAKAVSDMSSSYTVKLARDVDEAMVQVRRSQTTENMFDLVITDIKMTGLNGLELLEALHALAPDLKTIAMTAYTSSEISERANELGVQAYLTKPFMISEFRNVVRATLDTSIRQQDVTSEQPILARTASPHHKEIARALSSLRTMTAADAAFLLRNDGTLILADARESERDVKGLGAELQAAQRAITEQMTRLFDQSCSVRQSFFGTDAYSVCTYRVNGDYTAAVVFGPKVREGQVWYYMRDAAGTLSRALGENAPPTPSRRRVPRDSLVDALDRFFPSTPQPAADPEPVTEGTAAPGEPGPVSVPSEGGESSDALLGAGHSHSAAEPSAVQDLGAQADDPSLPQEPKEPPDPSIADSIDWEAIDSTSWDAILKDTDKGWEGISLDEARQRGLIDDLEGA